jgi:hypothetical protein
VRDILASEVMAPNSTREPTPLGHTADVDLLARLEDGDRDLGTDSQIRTFAALEPELAQHLTGLDRSLGVMTRHGFGDARGPSVAKGHLDCAVTICLSGLDLTDPVRLHFDDGHSDALPVLAEQAGHTGLTPNHSDRHGFVLSST